MPGERLEVRHERLYVKVPGGDRLRKSAAGRLRYLLANLPPALRPLEDLFGVILALEPGTTTVALRALKDHGNPDVAALHVALDPRTLLLVRS